MKIVVADTETTGLDPAEGAALLEVAWVVLDDESGYWGYGTSASHFVRYDGIIPPIAKAIHHIQEKDVDHRSEAVERDALIHDMLAAEEPGDMLYAFHNSVFDKKFLPELKLPVICTWRCAMHLWPDAPSHSNQVLRYWCRTEPPMGLIGNYEPSGYGEGGIWTPLAPHRAAYDAAVTSAVLLRMLQLRTPEQLVELTSLPVLQKTCKFGKHKGKAWSDVPRDYLQWMLKSSDMVRDDADLRHTVRHHLGLST